MSHLLYRKRASVRVIWPTGEEEEFGEALRSIIVEEGHVLIINHDTGKRTILPPGAHVVCYPVEKISADELPGHLLTEGTMTVNIESSIANENLEEAYRTIKSIGERLLIFRHSTSVMTLPPKDAKVSYEK